MDTLLQRLTKLLDVEDEKVSARLSHWLSLTELEILSYCNLEKLPAQLEVVVIDIVANLYEEAFDPSLTQLKQGENSYTFNVQKVRSRLEDYSHILHNYTCL